MWERDTGEIRGVAPRILQSLGDNAESKEWEVLGVELGLQRPDFVARSPEGTTYIVEVKYAAEPTSSTHFDEVAQLDSMRSHLSPEFKGSKVHAVLATNSVVPEGIKKFGRGLDVEFVDFEGEEPTSIARHIFKSLSSEQES